MNRVKVDLIIEIVFTILFVVISIPLWNSFKCNDVRQIAYSYDNYKYLNFDYQNLDTSQYLYIYNDYNYEAKYEVIFKVNKNIDMVSYDSYLNGNITNFNKIDYKNDSIYNYYLVDTGVIAASGKEYMLYFFDKNNEIVTFDDEDCKLLVV